MSGEVKDWVRAEIEHAEAIIEKSDPSKQSTSYYVRGRIQALKEVRRHLEP